MMNQKSVQYRWESCWYLNLYCGMQCTMVYFAFNCRLEIIDDYFRGQTLIYQTDCRAKEVPIGISVGTLWNIMYNAVLRLKFPIGCTIVHFFDGIIVVLITKIVRKIKENAYTVIVVYSTIEVSKDYLDEIVHDRLNYKDHIEFASIRAPVTQRALARIMPNIGGPNTLKRRKIAIVFHASPI